jgi:DNA-binding beta-propeller fold protein YncE
MKKSKTRFMLVFMVILLAGTSWWLNGRELPIIRLQEGEAFDYAPLLEENEIFLRNPFGFEYDGTHFYYLDSHFRTIFKVKQDSFKLVKTISSRGQGPGEIAMGIALCYKKGKLYVVDFGYGGIKIFDTQGKFVKQFKVSGFGIGGGMTSKSIIDVNANEEIYLRCLYKKSSLISVFDSDGNRLRGLIPIKEAEDTGSHILKNRIIFSLDKNGNLIVLFTKYGQLEKYDPKGVRLWSRNILQDLPKKERNEEGVKRTRAGGIKYSVNFSGLAVSENGQIFASGIFTGLLLSEKGTLIGRFKSPGGKGGFGDLLFWKGTRLIGLERQFDFQRYFNVQKSPAK